MQLKTPIRLSHKIQLQIKRSLQKRHSLRPITIKWINIQGFQCKKIIKQNFCFCNHSYGQHQYHYTMKPYCRDQRCNCTCFQYVPHFKIKCLCKHSSKDHDKQTKKCKFCTKCNGFLSSWACKCGFKFHQHKTQIYEEWDKQIQILPCIDKRYMVNSNTLSVKKSYNPIQQDLIDQTEKISFKQDKPQLSQSQQFRKNRLRQANQRVFKIDSNHKYAQKKGNKSLQQNHSDIFITPRKSIQQVDYSGTPLQLILSPHRYRFANLSNFVVLQNKNNNKYR